MSRILLFSVILLLTVGEASAADLRAELAQCRGTKSLALRLQCYDRVVDGSPAVEAAPTVSSVSPATGVAAGLANVAKPQTVIPIPTPAVAPKPVEKIKGEELFGKSSDEVKQAVTRELEISDIEQISSMVTRIQINSVDEYVVYLENGQIWKQTNKAGKWRIKVGETAIISKALLGSYLMKSDARKKSVRAERLR